MEKKKVGGSGDVSLRHQGAAKITGKIWKDPILSTKAVSYQLLQLCSDSLAILVNELSVLTRHFKSC